VDQNEFSLRFKKLDTIGSAVQAVIKYGALVGVAAIFSSALKVLAGKETILSVVMLIVAKFNLTQKVAYTIGFGGVLYGYRQRRLRRKVIENMSEHERALEKLLDPGRTSSEITSSGTTRPDDKSLG
jgi:hypothetical protein